MNTIRVVLRGHSWTLPPPAIALTAYPTLLHGSLPCGSVSTPPSQPTAPQLLFMTTTIGCRTYKCRSSSSPYFCLSFRQVGNSCLISKSCPRHGRLCCLPCTTDLKTRVGVFWRLKISLLLLLYHQKVWHAHLGYPSICIHKRRGCVHLSGAPSTKHLLLLRTLFWEGEWHGTATKGLEEWMRTLSVVYQKP